IFGLIEYGLAAHRRRYWRLIMQRPSTCLALCLVLAGLMLALPPATAEEFAPDHTFRAALAKHDAKIVPAMIAQDFSWITADGEISDGVMTLAALDTFAAALKDESEVQVHFYGRSINGRLATVRGVHNGMRFLRIYARRARGWQAFAMIDTPVATQAGP